MFPFFILVFNIFSNKPQIPNHDKIIWAKLESYAWKAHHIYFSCACDCLIVVRNLGIRGRTENPVDKWITKEKSRQCFQIVVICCCYKLTSFCYSFSKDGWMSGFHRRGSFYNFLYQGYFGPLTSKRARATSRILNSGEKGGLHLWRLTSC